MQSQAVALALSCIALALVALVLSSSQTYRSPVAHANHEDGHLHDWSLAPGAQTALLQKLISGPTPTLCSDEFPSSTQTAATRWRDTAGTGGGNTIDLFAYQSGCTGADIIVTTAGFSVCAPGSHGCTQPSGIDSDYGLVLPIYIRMNPSLFGSGEQWPDGHSHTTADITHELGHALGHADYDGCPGGQATLMDTTEACPYSTPQPLDEDNYHKAYHADAVASFAGTSGGQGPHAVRFTWDGSDIHNEREYLINWRNNCTGQWQPLYAPPKNSSSKTLTGLQGGLQEFQILPLTNADPQHAPPYAGEARNVTVNVVASLTAPAGMAASFPSTTANRFEWPAVAGADHYKIRADFVPAGVFTPSCAPAKGAEEQDSITGTQYDDALPIALAPVYRRVMACTAADLCSALSSAFTVSEQFDSGDWDYVFTYYRSVDDINLDFINFNPNLMALQLDIRDGITSSSPLVTSSACIPYGAIGSVGLMSASSFSSGNLAAGGHGVVDAGECAPTPNHTGDSSTVGSGQIPPQAGPCCKPAADGNLSGVYDLQVMDQSFALTLFHCISRLDHDSGTNIIKSSSQCYVDFPGQGDPADVLSGVNVPGEGVDFPNPGPPPPPPYTIRQPTKGSGFFDTTGTSPECVFYFPLAASCSVIYSCFADVGAGVLGPNLGIWLVIGDPKNNPAFGKV